MKKLIYYCSFIILFGSQTIAADSTGNQIKLQALESSKVSSVTAVHQLKLVKLDKVPVVITPAPHVVPDTSSNDIVYKVSDNCSGAEAGNCTYQIATSDDVSAMSFDTGMIGVMGTGIRLPDDQLESVDGLEDEWR